jgi:hypothetical protein
MAALVTALATALLIAVLPARRRRAVPRAEAGPFASGAPGPTIPGKT